jgi:hypothetical protein
MAEDWIRVRVNLPNEPEVGRLARILGLDEDAVLGKLVRLWCLCDQNTSDGYFVGLSRDWLDARMRHQGFASALETVGWLLVGDDGMRIPKFGRHNGMCAKNRIAAARRKRLQRSREKVTGVSRAASSLLSSSLHDAPEGGKEGERGGVNSPSVEEARVRLEGFYDETSSRLLQEITGMTGVGRALRSKIFVRLREPKAETLAAWRAYAESHGGAASVVGRMDLFGHPDELPPEPKGKTFAQSREAETEEAENRKRAMDLEAQQARRAEAAARRDKTRPEELSVMLEKFKEKLR